MYTGRRTITAKFNGACQGCSKKITKGEVIFFQSAFKSWHEECWKIHLHELARATIEDNLTGRRDGDK